MNSLFQLLAQDEPKWWEGVLPAMIFLGSAFAIFAVSVFLGRVIANWFRCKDHAWKISTIFGTIIVAAILAFGGTYNREESRYQPLLPLKLGVDLKGGVTIIGELNNQDLRPGETAIKVQDIIPKLMDRIDPSGTREITIRALDDTRMEVIIPDVSKPEADRIWQRLTQTGQLLFRIVVASGENFGAKAISQADAMMKNGDLEPVVRDVGANGEQGEIIAQWYKIARIRDPDGKITADSPFKFIPNQSNLVRASTGELVDMKRIEDSLLRSIDYQNDPNADIKAGKILAMWADRQGYPELEVLMIEPPDEEDDYNVEGKHLKNSSRTTDSKGNIAISFDMKKEGTRRMMRLTTKNKDRQMAIILEGRIHTAPNIRGTITSRGIIEGRFTKEEVTDLITTLNSGKIDVAMNKNPISVDFVASNLGRELLEKGLYAIGVSFVLVIIFMIFYYRFSGIVACTALLLNLLFLFALVKLIKQPLTLTGLAGIVLTVGMSVDANVLIFERIREELTRGASLRMAIRNGFDRATTTIVDANLTTLITALVLYVIGTEQIKGFSITLIIGILMSMFTAIFCSRVVFELGERKGLITKLAMMRILKKTDWDFLSKRGIFAVVSVVVIVVGLGCVYLRGASILDHDLRGGSTARVVFKPESPLTIEDVRKKLNDYEYTFNDGEEITFTVAELKEDDEADDDAVRLRVKIDSNLPIQERAPEDGSPPIKKLEEILIELFGKDLERPDVQFDSNTIKVNRLTSHGGSIPIRIASAVPMKGSAEGSADSNSSVGWRQRLFFDAINTSTMSALTAVEQDKTETGKQDDKKKADDQKSKSGQFDPTKQDDKKKSTGNSGNSKTVPGKQDDTKKDDTKKDDAKKDDAKKDDAKKDDAKKDDAKKDDGKKQDSGDKAGKQDPDSGKTLSTERYEASCVLEFKFLTARSDVTSGLVQAARDAGVVLDERNVVCAAVSTEDRPDDGSEKYQAKTWEVRLKRLVKSEDANAAFTAYQTELASHPYLPTVSGVGGQIAARTQWQALAAMVASLIGIIAYVWVRFQNVAFGLAAVVALIHDVLVVLGAIAVSVFVADYLGFMLIDNFKISLPVVAAFLTIIGYSLNDTIVVFDRIREVRGKRTELTAEMINQSISQTLSRTILTSLTTFIVVFILFAAGGQAIHGFAFALVIGVIVGTYSSIFVASPALLFLMKHTGGNTGEGKEKSGAPATT